MQGLERNTKIETIQKQHLGERIPQVSVPLDRSANVALTFFSLCLHTKEFYLAAEG